jgi:GTP-binding protein
MERPLAVERTDEGFAVTGTGVERMVIMTDMRNEDAVAHLQNRLARAGVERALLEAGARPGDTVRIGPVSFEFEVESSEG